MGAAAFAECGRCMQVFADSVLEGFPECLRGFEAGCGGSGIVHVSELRSFKALLSVDDCSAEAYQGAGPIYHDGTKLGALCHSPSIVGE